MTNEKLALIKKLSFFWVQHLKHLNFCALYNVLCQPFVLFFQAHLSGTQSQLYTLTMQSIEISFHTPFCCLRTKMAFSWFFQFSVFQIFLWNFHFWSRLRSLLEHIFHNKSAHLSVLTYTSTLIFCFQFHQKLNFNSRVIICELR
jgi:hypothetical protein